MGQVQVGGSSLPAVRVEINPQALYKYGIGFEDVRAALAGANANRPKGVGRGRRPRYWQIDANDQAKTAADYLPLIVAYRNGAPVGLTDVAEVVDSVQDLRNAGSSNGKPSVLVIISRQPNANIIETVDRVTELLPDAARVDPERDRPRGDDGAHDDDPRVAARCRADAGVVGGAGRAGGVPVPAQRPRGAHSRASRCRFRSPSRSASCTSSATASTTCR